MAVIEFEGGEGGSWQPLPAGTYEFLIQAVEQKTSKAGNAQLQVSLTVEGGEYNQKKCNDFFSLLPQAGWKLRNLLQAVAEGKYEEIDTGKKDGEGKPLFKLSFDTEDLIGKTFCADVTIEPAKDTGKLNNRFNNYRDPNAEAPAAKKPVQMQSVGAATSAAAPPQAAPAARRRVNA